MHTLAAHIGHHLTLSNVNWRIFTVVIMIMSMILFHVLLIILYLLCDVRVQFEIIHIYNYTRQCNLVSTKDVCHVAVPAA